MKVFARGRAIAEDSSAVNRDAGIRRQFRVPGLRSTVLSILAASLLLLPSQAHAQGPGLGNLTYGPNEMFKAISVINSPNGHGKVAMVNGYLMVIYSSDGGGNSGNGGIEFWDVSDPRNPVMVVRHDNFDTHGLREPHGFGFSNSYPGDYMVAQGVDGIQFWELSDP